MHAATFLALFFIFFKLLNIGVAEEQMHLLFQRVTKSCQSNTYCLPCASGHYMEQRPRCIPAWKVSAAFYSFSVSQSSSVVPCKIDCSRRWWHHLMVDCLMQEGLACGHIYQSYEWQNILICFAALQMMLLCSAKLKRRSLVSLAVPAMFVELYIGRISFLQWLA